MPTKLRKPSAAREADQLISARSTEEKMYQATNELSPSAGRKLNLPKDLRSRLEGQTGYNLRNIQMRESDQPAKIGARAYARGNVIDFAPGSFQPGSKEGEAVIGHEVSHVIQQAQGQVRADTPFSPVNSDPALEHAADTMTQRAPSSAAPASIPAMSYSAAPVQGFFGGLKKKFQRAKASYQFGKSRKKLEDFMASDTKAAKKQIASWQEGIDPNNAVDMKVAELGARNHRNDASSDQYWKLQAESQDVGGALDESSQMDNFWARLGRGTLTKRSRDKRLRQADEYMDSAIIDKKGSEDLERLKNQRVAGPLALQKEKTMRGDRSRQADDFFGQKLSGIDGGRQIQGLFRPGEDSYNRNLGFVSTLDLNQADSSQFIGNLVSAVGEDVVDVMNFDGGMVDLNNFDAVSSMYSQVKNLSSRAMLASDLLKKFYNANGGAMQGNEDLKASQRDQIFAYMGYPDPAAAYQKFTAKFVELQTVAGKMTKILQTGPQL